jgi:hypothetical protein
MHRSHGHVLLRLQDIKAIAIFHVFTGLKAFEGRRHDSVRVPCFQTRFVHVSLMFFSGLNWSVLNVMFLRAPNHVSTAHLSPRVSNVDEALLMTPGASPLLLWNRTSVSFMFFFAPFSSEMHDGLQHVCVYPNST